MNDDNRPDINLNDFLKKNQFDISSEVKKLQPSVILETTHQSRMKELLDIADQQNKIELEKELNQIAREERQIELLEEIKNNTGSLVNMVDLIRVNSNQQSEILSIIAEIMVLGTFDDKAEAESSFRKIMNSINQKIEDTESMIMLTDMAKLTWEYVKTNYLGG